MVHYTYGLISLHQRAFSYTLTLRCVREMPQDRAKKRGLATNGTKSKTSCISGYGLRLSGTKTTLFKALCNFQKAKTGRHSKWPNQGKRFVHFTCCLTSL